MCQFPMSGVVAFGSEGECESDSLSQRVDWNLEDFGPPLQRTGCPKDRRDVVPGRFPHEMKGLSGFRPLQKHRNTTGLIRRPDITRIRNAACLPERGLRLG